MTTLVRWGWIAACTAGLAACAKEPPAPAGERRTGSVERDDDADDDGRDDDDDDAREDDDDDDRVAERDDRDEGKGAARGGPRREAGAPTPAPVPAPVAAPGAPRPPAPRPDGITQVNSREWTISEDLLDEWKGSPGMLGRVRKVEGGWEIYGIRQRAGYYLGMRNGDIITSVNGHELETRMQQIGAWFDLRNDETFNLVFLRNGQRYSYTYRTVED